MRTVRSAAVTGTAVLGGLLFAPVFGVTALLVPVTAAALAVLAVTLLCRRSLIDWRPVLAALAGLLAVTETVLWRTTTAGLPTAATLHGLTDGVTRSWWRTLETTWPARPDPELLIFVPLLVVVAAVTGLELYHRLGSPLPALLPGLALLVFAQAHIALGAHPAILVALAWVALAGMLLASARATSFLPVAASAAGAAVLAGLALPATPPRVTLRADPALPPVPLPLTSPLDELAGRLARPRTPVFRVRAPAVPDRWPVVVLDRFDGVNWTPGDGFRRLGARLAPGIPGPVHERAATITDAPGPWLPSQSWPAEVRGAAPYVAPDNGTLLLPSPAMTPVPGAADYTLRWWEPQLGGDALLASGVNERAPRGLDPIGTAPPGLTELAVEATGRQRPSFRAALTLEAWFRARYRLAVGTDLPAGHGWSQITSFLLTTRRGTSEQFAAAYVVLARLTGIPARLAVGFRTPAHPDTDGSYTIGNGDALAWPEVAVPDVGWVPLDPTGEASTGGVHLTGLAAAAEKARLGSARPPGAAAPVPPGAHSAPPSVRPWRLLLAVPAALLLWPVIVPAVWALRAARRRRRGVAEAAREACDRLLAYGVPITSAMTLRDVATVVPEAATALTRLGSIVDRATWSGEATVPAEDRREAWSAVHAIRHAVAARGPRARAGAAMSLRGLTSPRRATPAGGPAGTTGPGP